MARRLLTPAEVRDAAARAEARPPASMHPLIGSTEDEAEILLDDPAGLLSDQPAPRKPQRVRSTYCDHCGHVDDHAIDCPQRAAEEAIRETRREEVLEQIERGESVGGLVRKLGAAVLRRLAKRLDP